VRGGVTLRVGDFDRLEDKSPVLSKVVFLVLSVEAEGEADEEEAVGSKGREGGGMTGPPVTTRKQLVNSCN
jgi:hypothetical protein